MTAHKTLSNITLRVLMGLALVLPPIVANALEWTAQPSISAGVTVNDNINLVTTPHDTEWGTTLIPQLTLSASSQQSSLSGQTQINRRDYSNNNSLSRTDGLLSLTFTRLYERSQFSLASNLTRDSTLESELLATGVVSSYAQRTSRTLSPSWAYALTQLDSLTLGYSYLDVTYGATTTTSGLLDYTVKDPSITLSHAFTEKNKLNLSLDYSDYESQSSVTDTTNQYRYTTTSVQLGFSREFSETLIASLMAGVSKTDSTVDFLNCLPIPLPSCFPVPAESNSSTTGSLFRGSLQQAFESSNLSAELSRSLQPTSNGGLTQTDRLSGLYSVKLTPTLSSSLNMSFYDSKSSGASSIANNSRYYNISPAISWRITQWWSANTTYSRSVSKDEGSTEATDNAISLTLNYSWPKISKSR
jgi:hypothetical protein